MTKKKKKRKTEEKKGKRKEKKIDHSPLTHSLTHIQFTDLA